MGKNDILQTIGGDIPGVHAGDVAFVGEGDFCRAYSVQGRWIFRFARNAEGSRSLEVEARLLPALAPVVHTAIPGIIYSGQSRTSGLHYVGYPTIYGDPLTSERLSALAPSARELCAANLAAFLRDLHGFDTERALGFGAPKSSYPLCRTEAGIVPGAAEDLYPHELTKLLRYRKMDGRLGSYCRDLCHSLTNDALHPPLPPALVHGDLSSEHILFDSSTQRITGIIDFTDVIVSTPLLDFAYLTASYGEPFLSQVLVVYLNNASVLAAVKAATLRLYRWYEAIRLLWALEHDYRAGIEIGLRRLFALVDSPERPTS